MCPLLAVRVVAVSNHGVHTKAAMVRHMDNMHGNCLMLDCYFKLCYIWENRPFTFFNQCWVFGMSSYSTNHKQLNTYSQTLAKASRECRINIWVHERCSQIEIKCARHLHLHNAIIIVVLVRTQCVLAVTNTSAREYVLRSHEHSLCPCELRVCEN